MLVHTFIDSRRRRWWSERPTAVLPEDSTGDPNAGSDTADAVERALGGLTDDQRTAVVLCYFLHMSEHEMAIALGVKSGTVKSRLSRALGVLAVNPNMTDLEGTQ